VFKRHWATKNNSAAMDIASNVPNDQPVTSRLSFSWFSLPKIRNRKTGIKRIGYASFGVGLLLVWLIVTLVTLLPPFVCTQTGASRVSFANDEVKYQRKNYSPIRRTTTNSQNDAVDVSQCRGIVTLTYFDTATLDSGRQSCRV
jgi:hypothetical protein